jgi:hypothetical protein
VILICCHAHSFRTEHVPYGGGWQSFVNAPSRTEILEPGTTHVAIGFVDLGGLAAACEMLTAREPELADVADFAAAYSGSSSSSRQGNWMEGLRRQLGVEPLRWVGYEMSAYCVSKTLVVLQMVEQGAAVDEILQVRRWAPPSSRTVFGRCQGKGAAGGCCVASVNHPKTAHFHDACTRLSQRAATAATAVAVSLPGSLFFYEWSFSKWHVATLYAPCD